MKLFSILDLSKFVIPTKEESSIEALSPPLAKDSSFVGMTKINRFSEFY